jgi:streptogramin lyase
MGVVYLAEDLRLSRKVALKLLAPALAESERFRDRFLRETKVAASIDHPNIVPIYDAGETEGSLYFAMRYVEGTDLHRLIRSEGRLDPDRTLAIVTQVAAALDTAHGRGLVHRDVKPSNVLLVPRSGPAGTDHVYLSDYGLTKRAMSVSGLTETGQLIGTIDYVAPEQIKGDPVDGRADIYSLGCIVYECLTGEVPYPRDIEVAVLWAHVQSETPTVSNVRSDVPVELDAAIARAMAKAPDDRTPTGEALVADMRSALGYGGTGLRPHPIRGRKRAARGGRVAAIGALALIAIAAGAFLLRSTTGVAIVPGADTVARIADASGEFDTVVPVGNLPTGVAVGAGSVWVVNRDDQTLTRIDPVTGAAESSKSTLGTPTGITFGEGLVWITNGFGGQAGNAQVVMVEPTDNRVEEAFASPTAHAIVAAFGSVWLADPLEDKVYRFDPTTGERTAAIKFDLGSSPSFLAVGDGEASGVWVVNELAGNIAWIDPDTDEYQTFGVESPTAVAASGDAVWVTSNATDTVTRLNASTSTSVKTLTLGADDVPNGPLNVVIAPHAVWVTSSLDPVVARIDQTTNTVVETLAVRGVSDALAVDPDGNVWVTVHRQ